MVAVILATLGLLFQDGESALLAILGRLIVFALQGRSLSRPTGAITTHSATEVSRR